MKSRALVAAIAALSIALGLFAEAGGATIPARIASALEAGGRADLLLTVADPLRADIIAAASGVADPDARRAFLVAALSDRARITQKTLRALLAGKGVAHRSFWLTNQVLVSGAGAETLDAVASSPDVSRIDENPEVFNALPQPSGETTTRAPAAIPWNLVRVGADAAWYGLSARGQGVVVGIADTGVFWTHPALINAYRGFDGATADHAASWHDAVHDAAAGNPCGSESAAPCDDYGHGTHVTGIVVGDDGAGNQVGVAPGAKWIACRNMAAGWGTPARYTECFQWFLAPGGDPGLAPHVVNNSWGCTGSEGCSAETLHEVVTLARLSGVAVVASAGNSGPSCSSVTNPPGRYAEAFSVGNVDSSDALASSSSRGPVMVGGVALVKPDIAAPGTGIRSCAVGGGYATMSGTSMAAPHVAGGLALLWSAAPRLARQVDRSEAMFRRTATRKSFTACGDAEGAFPNNGLGWGILNAFDAARAARAASALPAVLQPALE